MPAILYGGHREPRALSLEHTRLLLLLDNERFYSTIINLKVGEQNQAAIVKDVQLHPAKNAIVHVDLQRVLDDEKIRIHMPLHFKNEAGAPGVKKGGIVSHLERGRDHLPAEGSAGVHRGRPVGRRLEPDAVPRRPQGAGGREIPELAHGRNSPVVSIHHARAAEEPEAAAGAEAAAAAAAAPAAARQRQRQRARRQRSRRPKPRRTRKK